MSSTWKQTIDGQWQLFTNLGEPVLTKEGIYKPSARTPAEDKVADNTKKQEVATSMSVWTNKGYGVVKEVLESGYKVKMEEDKVIEVDEVARKVSLKLRLVEGQKSQWIVLKEISIGSKVESLIDLISYAVQKPSFFISTMANGKQLDKKKSLSEEGIGQDANILVSLNSGKSKVFKRFRDISSSHWYVGSSWDAIGFRSERSLLVTGFGCYQNYYESNCEVKYLVFLDEEEVIPETVGSMTSATVVDKIGPIKFKNPVRLQPNVKLTIRMMHKEVPGQSSHAFYGNNGDNAQDIEGNEKFLKVESSDKDQNCTSTSTGQVPELHYIPF